VDDQTSLATVRYGLEPAPAGLSIVQELLNSGLPSEPQRDPLRSVETARGWLAAVAADWSARTEQPDPGLTASERDLPRLRRARQALRDWVTGQDAGRPASAAVSVHLEPGRGVSYAPGTSGPAGLEALVAVELLLADRLDRSRRLKVCANPACGAAFYDGSPNNSRRWHDVKTCGNIANLRASRARRSSRAGQVTPAPSDAATTE
jgi:hypothetical protein